MDLDRVHEVDDAFIPGTMIFFSEFCKDGKGC